MDNRNEIIKIVFVILLVSLPLFFFKLGSPGLTDRDEGSFSEATREMLETGDWLTPHFNYDNRFDKPILIYYIMALPYKVFGINEFGARFHSAFFGTLLILLVFFFVKGLKGIRVALLSSLILSSNLAVVALSRAAITDMVLIFFITASLFSFYNGLWVDRKWSWGFYIFSAFAFLVKGPVGVIVPLLVVIPYLISIRGKVSLKGFHPIAGTLLFLLISMPWFLIMIALHGHAYIDAARYHTLTRYGSVIGGHSGMILYYIPVVLFGFFPWSAFLPASIYYDFKNNWRLKGEDRGSSLIIFCSIWIFLVFLFFTSSKTKLPHYIGPLFPPMAILVANLLDSYLSKNTLAKDISEKWIKVSLYFLGILGVLISATFTVAGILSYRIRDLIPEGIPTIEGLDLAAGPFVISVIFFTGTLSSIYAYIRGSKIMGVSISVVMIVITVISIMFTIVPKVDGIFLAPQRKLAAYAGLNPKEGERLIVFGFYKPSLVFYSKKKVIFIKKENIDDLKKELSFPGPAIVLCTESSMGLLKSEGEFLDLITRENGYVLLSKKKNG